MKEKVFVFYCLSSIISNPGQGFLKILDKSTVEEGEIFTITCDYLRFDIPHDKFEEVWELTINRKLANYSKEKDVFSFDSNAYGRFRYIKSLPAGRMWDVWADQGPDDQRRLKEKTNLTIAVLDTVMADSGTYSCVMLYDYMGEGPIYIRRGENLTVKKSTYSKPTYTRKVTRITTAPTRPTTKAPKVNEPILDKSTVVEGESFSMTCDYQRFPTIVHSGIYFDHLVNFVQLSRQVEGSSSYSLIYRFSPRNISDQRLSDNIPPGRSWKVHIDHGDHDHYSYQQYVSLVVSVNDTIMEDSGSYECHQMFGTERQYKRSETLRVIKGKTKQTTSAEIKRTTGLTITEECEDLELTTSKNQSNRADMKDFQHSVLLLLIMILVMAWLL